MKINQRWAWAVTVAVGLAVSAGRAEQAAVVKKDRVNVRAQASPTSEVITQLKKGETVTVWEEVTAKKHKHGEPGKWARIQLPPNTPVWVYAPYVETTNHSVNIKRLNLRAGPGENFSVIGRLDRGAEVKEIRTEGNWMEIEAPTNAYAFVAAEMLEKSAVPPELAATTPAQPPPTLENVKPEPNPVPVVETAPPPALTPPVSQPATAAPADTPPPKRIVSREGTVVVSRSIQAPTFYALENRESHRTVNYLHSESEDINLKRFAGKKVIVMGEELIDQRWTNTPIVEVESIQVIP